MSSGRRWKTVAASQDALLPIEWRAETLTELDNVMQLREMGEQDCLAFLAGHTRGHWHVSAKDIPISFPFSMPMKRTGFSYFPCRA